MRTINCHNHLHLGDCVGTINFLTNVLDNDQNISFNFACPDEYHNQLNEIIRDYNDKIKIITNKNVLDRYYENKKRKNNKKRVCRTSGCSTILSTYNSENICEICKTERLIKRLSSWGWDEDKLREDWSF